MTKPRKRSTLRRGDRVAMRYSHNNLFGTVAGLWPSQDSVFIRWDNGHEGRVSLSRWHDDLVRLVPA